MKHSIHLSSGQHDFFDKNGLPNGPSIVSLYLDGEFIDEPSTLAAFYGTLKLIDYPKFFNDTNSSLGSYAPEMSFYSGPLNEDGFVLAENQVTIWYFSFNEIIDKQDFHSLNLQLAHKALEAVAWFDLLERGLVDKAWIASIKNWLIAKNSY